MAGYRKLGRTSSQRKALLRNQVTNLLYHGSIVTTEAKAKEIRKIAEGIIALGVKECNNYDTVTVTAKVARKDKDGKRVKEVVDGKKVTQFDEVEKEIRKLVERCRRFFTTSLRFRQRCRDARVVLRLLMLQHLFWMILHQSMLSAMVMVVIPVS